MNKTNEYKDYKKITEVRNANEFLQEQDEKCLVIYSKTAVTNNNIDISNKNFKTFSTKELSKEKAFLDQKFKTLNYKRIISIGGGSAMDMGKYLSSKFHVELVVIPTMLSTNAYATNKVALRVENQVQSLDATTPSKIILDPVLLKNSKTMNLYGLIDIFSIYTALNDWTLAIKYNQEEKHKAYNQAKKILDETIHFVWQNESIDIGESIEFIYRMIGESGLITNEFGCGKPESGSEHIFAKGLEKEMDVPHAVSVTNGMYLMMLAQEKIMKSKKQKEQSENVRKTLLKLGMPQLNKKYNITFNTIEKILLNLKPREDRFTVVNLIKDDMNMKKEILGEYKTMMKEWVDE